MMDREVMGRGAMGRETKDRAMNNREIKEWAMMDREMGSRRCWTRSQAGGSPGPCRAPQVPP